MGPPRELLRAHLHAHLEDATPRLREPPAELAAYLEREEETLRRIAHHLREAEPPSWEMDLDRYGSAPIPHLLGRIHLHQLLVQHRLLQPRPPAQPRSPQAPPRGP